MLADTRELMDQVRRTETLTEDLRRRNGELYVALCDVAPDRASSLSPAPDHHTRYLVLDRIVERATSLALRANEGEPIGAVEVEGLIDAVLANEHYWRDVEAERQKLRDTAERARVTRETNKSKGAK